MDFPKPLTPSPPEVQQNNYEEVSKKVTGFLSQREKSPECPFCRTDHWFMLENADFQSAVIMLTKGTGNITLPVIQYPVYVLVCNNCGFIRMHAKVVVDVGVAVDQSAGLTKDTDG